MNLVSEFSRMLTQGRLALFIGADLPHEITGLPSRANLARDLARRHDLVGQDGVRPLRSPLPFSLAQVAQRVARGGNRWEFTAFIRDALDTSGKPPQPFHRRIVHLVHQHHVNHLITTAYDNLLELAFQEANIPINRIVRGSDVSFINPDRPTLIKLYGDAQQPDTFVVTEDDHYGLWRDRDKEDLLDEVRNVLRRQTVLFLGYNLSDPDFNLLWREILDRAGRFVRTAYAVWPDLPEPEAQMWRDRGITILDTDPLGILGGSAPQPVPRSRLETIIPVPGGAEMPTWDAAAIRQLLSAAFDDGELTTLCFDYFRPVYEDLSSGMGKGQKIQRLLDYCDRHDQLSVLLERVKEANLSKYTRFAPRLRQKTLRSPIATPPSSPSKGEGEPSGPQPTHGTGNRWAVLVGVNEYQDGTNYGRLQVCVKDVEAIREQLIAGGFDPPRIRLLTDHTTDPPTKANILVALKAVADATEPSDLLLFYYSGHGDEDGTESYLVARDGRQLVLKDTAVPLSRVREIVQEAPARAKVIVLDACHSGADVGGKGPKKMSAAFIRRVFEEAEGLAVLASCKKGQLSYEWRDPGPGKGRSVFTHFLLEALTGEADRDDKDFVTVQDASRHVTDGVKLWASQHNLGQTPTLQYTVAGDIILTTIREGQETHDD